MFKAIYSTAKSQRSRIQIKEHLYVNTLYFGSDPFTMSMCLCILPVLSFNMLGVYICVCTNLYTILSSSIYGYIKIKGKRYTLFTQIHTHTHSMDRIFRILTGNYINMINDFHLLLFAVTYTIHTIDCIVVCSTFISFFVLFLFPNCFVDTHPYACIEINT